MMNTHNKVELGEILITVLHHYFHEKEYEWSPLIAGELLETAKFHGITALLVHLVPGDCLQSRQKRLAQIAVCRNDAIDYEYKEIIDYLEQNGIWYLPLKGIILKNYYPETWMREMADVDILYDTEHFSEVKRFMTERGYVISVREGSNCDSYQMADMYHFEMHKRLFDPDNDWFDYFKKVTTRMTSVDGKKQEYELSKEDFYIYFIAHSLKHFLGAGTGLRNLIDLYYFLEREQDNLDWAYIHKELSCIPAIEGVSIAVYEDTMRRLNQKLFCNDWEQLSDAVHELTSAEKTMLDCFLSDGTYGSKEKELENLMKKYTGSDNQGIVGKIHYLKRRLFPDKEWYKSNAPYCYEHPWSIPFYSVKRVVWGIGSIKRIWKEIKWVIRK